MTLGHFFEGSYLNVTILHTTLLSIQILLRV